MKIKILGSGGWYSTKTADTACILIDAKDCYVVLDAGEGIRKLERHIKDDKPIFLFLSHFHFDHIYGFHIFCDFRFGRPIKIFGQPGSKEILERIASHPYMMSLGEFKTEIIVQELNEGVHVPPETPFEIEARFLTHADPCFGYKLSLDGKTITYCTDTGICDNFVKLASRADVLISECTLLQGQHDDGWPHINPEDAAEAAKKAKARRLLLTHFHPELYPTNESRETAGKSARTIFPNTDICYDDKEFEI